MEQILHELQTRVRGRASDGPSPSKSSVWVIICDRIVIDVSIQVPNGITHLAKGIAREPSSSDGVIRTILGQVQAAIGVVKHSGIAEIGGSSGSLKSIAGALERIPFLRNRNAL
jgi:hypothetical protein